MEMETTVSAAPLEAFLERAGDGAKADFARALNISPQRLSNWLKRGVPKRNLREVALAMSLQGADDYHRLVDSGQKGAQRGQNGAKRNIPQSEAEKFLALVKTFLDTDANGQLEILEAALSLTQSDERPEQGRGRRKSRGR